MVIDNAIPLYLFAKAPIAGEVKTRMFPQLTPESSAALAHKMLEQSLDKICESWPGKVILTVAPDRDHPAFKTLSSKYDFTFTVQVLGSLGHRMLTVLKQGIEESGAAVVMGCDVPHFDAEVLLSTYQLLKTGRNVVGPAEDGGFYLLGLNQVDEALFYGVQWGGERVLLDVKKNAEKIPISLVDVKTLRDIDNWSDLQWLIQQDTQYQVFTSVFDDK